MTQTPLLRGWSTTPTVALVHARRCTGSLLVRSSAYVQTQIFALVDCTLGHAWPGCDNREAHQAR